MIVLTRTLKDVGMLRRVNIMKWLEPWTPLMAQHKVKSSWPVPNGYPIPDPNPKFFSIPDPYPICFQNHRVFRVSGISESYVFDMENCIKMLQVVDLYHLISSSFDWTGHYFNALWTNFNGLISMIMSPLCCHGFSKLLQDYQQCNGGIAPEVMSSICSQKCPRKMWTMELKYKT